MLNPTAKSTTHEKHLQYAKYNDRYAAPSYHYSGPNMALLPKPALFSANSTSTSSSSSTVVVGTKDPAVNDHKKVKNHCLPVLPKTGKKKGPKFVPKAILKKPEIVSGDSHKTQISSTHQICTSTQICTNSEISSTPPKLLQLLAKKNTKVVSPESAKHSSSIEDQLSGKICAMLGITPTTPC